jgi:hypothetical protein
LKIVISKRLVVAALAALVLFPLTLVEAQPVAAKNEGSRYANLRKIPKPRITGAQIMAGLEEFIEMFPLRQNMLQDVNQNVAAAEFLAEEAASNGFESRIIEFEGAGASGSTVRAVEAVKRGTKKPNEWIAFIAHYDTVPGVGATIQGAYDDGSGTNMLRFFGKAFSKIKTKRSIALLWFDAEEDGLLGSELYLENPPKGVKFHAALGFDMVGIGYPAPYCICVYHGPLDATAALPIIDHVNFGYLKYPEGDGGAAATEKWPVGGEGHVCSCGVNIRNSDESNFSKQGIFTLRWTGMRTANDYPGYHQPWDTIQFMELVAGSRENLELGMENTFKSAYYTTFVLDDLNF